MRLTSTLVFWMFVALALFPFNPEETLVAQSSVIRLDVNLVELQAHVTDQNNRSVSGLSKQAFQLLVDDVAQPITVFRGEDTPVTAGIVVDNSASMAPNRSDVIAAALEFARDSNSQDQMFVIHFSDHPRLELPTGKLFSSNVGELESAISKFDLGGTTALYDAVLAALDHLRQADFGKKVLLIITDGRDNSSRVNVADVIKNAQMEDAVIFAVGLFFEEPERLSNSKVLSQLAESTGGQAFFPVTLPDITATCRVIAREIRTQYTFAFVGAEDGKYHRIKVEAHDAKYEKLDVHTRGGYFAKSP